MSNISLVKGFCYTLFINYRSSVSGGYSQSNMSSISETRTEVSEDGEKRKTKVSKV